MKFQCDTTSRVPIYRQLIEQVRAGIATGKLQPGDRLPSVRQLSKELVVNPNTIARTYTELERDGMLHTRQGLGVFVAEWTSELTKQSRREKLVAALDHFLTEAVHLGFSAEEVQKLLAERAGRFCFATAAGESG